MRNLDRSSLLSFAQTSFGISATAQATIFRHINFFHTPKEEVVRYHVQERMALDYGADLIRSTSSLIEVFKRKGAFIEVKTEEKEAEDALTLEKKKYGWVQSLKIVSHPMINQANITLFNSTSSSLTTLSIQAAHSYHDDYVLRDQPGETLLEVRLLRDFRAFHPPAQTTLTGNEALLPTSDDSTESMAPSSEPNPQQEPTEVFIPIDTNLTSLTQVTIGKNSIRYVEFLPLLLKIAPNLTHLRIIMNNQHSKYPDPEFDITFLQETKIRNLSITYTEYYSASNSQSLDIILDLLAKSPYISALSFDYEVESDDFEDFEDRTIAQIAELPALSELDWRVEMKKY